MQTFPLEITNLTISPEHDLKRPARFAPPLASHQRPHTCEPNPDEAVASLVRSSDDDSGTPSRGTTEGMCPVPARSASASSGPRLPYSYQGQIINDRHVIR